MGVCTAAHVNQSIALASLRPAFAHFLGITGGRRGVVVRIGRGPDMLRSIRSRVESALL